mgnify:FL=1
MSCLFIFAIKLGLAIKSIDFFLVSLRYQCGLIADFVRIKYALIAYLEHGHIMVT